ncbi:MAG: uncharacterized protein KVP18_002583 [Porospora cf. gigantea A]|uniref:uncharacterized protein n=1 Tax=Porospora cf. gigantea A TaxID=2853593 RepID=UPI003559FA8F|nr:MAG: hypothetical protein KVP18_002583 [Porospora cf. gigantea A]
MSCCRSKSNYSLCCGCCSLRSGLLTFFILNILGGLSLIPVRVTGSAYATPSWILVALAVAFGVFGLYALASRKARVMGLCRVLYKVYIGVSILTDMASVALQLWLIIDLDRVRRLLDEHHLFFEDQLPETDLGLRGVLIGVLVVYIALRSVFYLISHIILGAMKSISEVYKVGGSGRERLNAAALQERKSQPTTNV